MRVKLLIVKPELNVLYSQNCKGENSLTHSSLLAAPTTTLGLPRLSH